jgi:predicted flap endonuclease-1-like 5' DNA nuclease
VGILLVFALLMTGRLIRHRMLITPDGAWREHLWLDELVLAPGDAEAAEKARKPELTSPLPINTCSVDSLTLLPGVGPVLAGRIQDIRAEGHIFHNAEDLRMVKGIGPALSARLAPLVDFSVDAALDSVSEDSLQN